MHIPMQVLSTQFDCHMFITLEKENEVALQQAEMRMVSWMCGVKVKDRFPSKELRERLGIDDITLVLQQNRLQWYEHVLRKEDDDWAKKSTKHPPLVATYVDASHAHTHKNPFNSPLSQTTCVTWYQKGKTNLDFTEARDREWQWHQLGHMQVCPRSRQITTPAPHHSVFYRPDALPVAQPTVSKQRRQYVHVDASLGKKWNTKFS